MNSDKIEIILSQLKALTDLWHLLRAASSDLCDKESCEELLLHVFESNLKELGEAVKSIE